MYTVGQNIFRIEIKKEVEDTLFVVKELQVLSVTDGITGFYMFGDQEGLNPIKVLKLHIFELPVMNSKVSFNQVYYTDSFSRMEELLNHYWNSIKLRLSVGKEILMRERSLLDSPLEDFLFDHGSDLESTLLNAKRFLLELDTLDGVGDPYLEFVFASQLHERSLLTIFPTTLDILTKDQMIPVRNGDMSYAADLTDDELEYMIDEALEIDSAAIATIYNYDGDPFSIYEEETLIIEMDENSRPVFKVADDMINYHSSSNLHYLSLENGISKESLTHSIELFVNSSKESMDKQIFLLDSILNKLGEEFSYSIVEQFYFE